MGTTTASSAEFQNGGKPVAQPIYMVDQNGNVVNGCTSATIAAGAAGPTTIKAGPGVLFGVLCTTSAAGVPTAYDNASAASGNIIAAIAGGAAIGTGSALPGCGVRFNNGLTLTGGASMPALTIFYN